MATATKKFPPASSPQPRAQERAPSPSVFDRFARLIDAIYRFLASLKLAVFSISTLAATLAYATFFESWYGAGAAQEYIYRSPGFAILLAFLGMNILCAALIRYPWKKRQTGFVVTHAGLLILLLGSYYSVRTADEGQVGMLEGDVKSELVRIDYPVIRVLEIDPHTGEHTRETDLPFRPGPFEWGPGKPRSPGFLGRALSLVSFGLLGPSASTEEVLTQPGDPFRFVVKEHLPASVPAVAHVADPDGCADDPHRAPVQGAGHAPGAGCLPVGRGSLVRDRAEVLPGRPQPAAGPAGILATSTGPSWSTTSSSPRPSPGTKGVARFRYRDRSGKTRVFDWALDGQEGKSVALPESDLTVTLSQATEFPTRRQRARTNSGRRLDSRSPCSRSSRARTSRSPTWHSPTCRWSPT